MRTQRQLSGSDLAGFLAKNPVFPLAALAREMKARGRRTVARERVKYHLETGRLKLVSKGVYAAVPAGMSAREFQPDRYLVAAAIRPDAVFSHHAALELLGAAHSDWSVCTAFTSRRRGPVRVRGVTIQFVVPPPPFRVEAHRVVGVVQVDRLGMRLRVTGRERTLLDGFRQPRLVGGLEELVDSASGFGVLDLELLEKLLHLYDQRILWAAAGWFLERHREQFFVDDKVLKRLERHRPRSRQYLPRGARRGGRLAARWNLVLPAAVLEKGKTGDV